MLDRRPLLLARGRAARGAVRAVVAVTAAAQQPTAALVRLRNGP